jgi:hypothetical protein
MDRYRFRVELTRHFKNERSAFGNTGAVSRQHTGGVALCSYVFHVHPRVLGCFRGSPEFSEHDRALVLVAALYLSVKGL